MDPWIWTAICFVLALILAALELFVTSGGILALLSVFAVVGSILFAFFENTAFGTGYLIALMIMIPLFLWYVSIWWPSSRMGRTIMLNPDEDPALQPDDEILALKGLVGKTGLALSRMMLSGLIEIDGKRFNALSESETIDQGDQIVVTKVDGIEVLVRKISDPSVQEPSRNLPNASPTGDEVSVEDPFF